MFCNAPECEVGISIKCGLNSEFICTLFTFTIRFLLRGIILILPLPAWLRCTLDIDLFTHLSCPFYRNSVMILCGAYHNGVTYCSQAFIVTLLRFELPTLSLRSSPTHLPTGYWTLLGCPVTPVDSCVDDRTDNSIVVLFTIANQVVMLFSLVPSLITRYTSFCKHNFCYTKVAWSWLRPDTPKRRYIINGNTRYSHQ